MNRMLRGLVIGVSFRTVLCFVFAIALLGPAESICAAQQTTTAAGRTRTADVLAWYDTLGFPDTTGRPYVRVATGWSRQVSDGSRESRYVEGFLLREDAESFTVFISGVSTLGFAGISENLSSPRAPLDVFRFVRKADGPEYERVLYERIDLAARARDVIKRGRRTSRSDRTWFDYPFGNLPTQRVQIFVLARAAMQNGLQREASALFDLIERRLPTDLLRALQQSIGDFVEARMRLDTLNPSHSWEELQQGYSTFAQRFPANDKVPRARAAAETLQRMIAEEKTHPARSIAALTPPEQAAEWIYRLRDMPTMYYYPPMYSTPRDESEKAAFHYLKDLSDAAVPALLDALADDSFTRTKMSYGGSGDGTAWPMRVSDFAIAILESMAGRTFPRTEASNAAARPAAEAWWTEVQRKGARQQLMDDTAAGGKAGMVAASKLVQRYPESAVGPIGQALSTAQSKGVRAQFVDIAKRIPGDSVLPLLRAQLVPQAGMRAQNIAASALLVRGYRDVVPAMIQSWHDLQPLLRDPVPPLPPLQPNGAGGRERDDPLFDAGGLIAFLARSSEPRAIEALAEEGPKAAVDVRLHIVWAFVPLNLPPDQPIEFFYPTNDRLDSYGHIPHGFPAASDASQQAVDAAIDKLLRTALLDTALLPQTQIKYGGKTLDTRRMCDIAALVLALRWPERYAFDISADKRARNAAITVMRDSERK